MRTPEQSQPEKEAICRVAAREGRIVQYRNHPNYKGLPVDWTDCEKGTVVLKGRLDGFQIRLKPVESGKVSDSCQYCGSLPLGLHADWCPLFEEEVDEE